MMRERIVISNFGGLKKVEFDLRDINILIGPQASGKSVTVKLFYYFKSFIKEFYASAESGDGKRELDRNLKEKFLTYFPIEAWPNGSFRIVYHVGEEFISVDRQSAKAIKLDYSEGYRRVFKRGKKYFNDAHRKYANKPEHAWRVDMDVRDRFYNCVNELISPIAGRTQYFVPAGRSFFANIQSSIFSFLSNNKSLDPFLIEFGSFYENFKSYSTRSHFQSNKLEKDFERIINDIMNGSYVRDKEKDYIVHKDNRKVNLTNASSGQQETLPLAIVLRVINSFGNNAGATLYIEEPEAHIFPTAQKKIIQLLARLFNKTNSEFQLIITTHSPYILSSFNNLLEAGKIVNEMPNKANEVFEIVSKKELLDFDTITACSIANGKKTNLLDDETKLIYQNSLDEVSDELAINFGKLLDIEY